MFANHAFDIFAVDILHDDVSQIPLRVDLNVNDRNDIGRLDPAGQTGLPDKSIKGDIPHSAGPVGAQQFQGVLTFKKVVVCQIDFPHTSCADTAFDGVVAQMIISRKIGV